MKFVFIALAIVTICAEEMLVTHEYVDYLKQRVDWEVMDYEDNIFRGWTIEEAKQFLGGLEDDYEEYYPSFEPDSNLPSSINWAGANCDHGVKDQGKCGSCWALASAGMLSDRCCMHKKDYGWLAPQELVSCSKILNQGCRGGWCTWAIDYVMTTGGLVPEACFPYLAQDVVCPKTCVDGSDWAKAHVCNCEKGYKIADSVQKIKTGLKTGPVTTGFAVCRSFFSYKDGIYKCDCDGQYVGVHAVLIMGYTEKDDTCYYTIRNSWGTAWGRSGYFDIYCDTCGISGNYPKGNVYCSF